MIIRTEGGGGTSIALDNSERYGLIAYVKPIDFNNIINPCALSPFVAEILISFDALIHYLIQYSTDHLAHVRLPFFCFPCFPCFSVFSASEIKVITKHYPCSSPQIMETFSSLYITRSRILERRHPFSLDD